MIPKKNSQKPVFKKDKCTKVKSSAAQNTNLCMITTSDCFLFYYINLKIVLNGPENTLKKKKQRVRTGKHRKG